VHEGVGHSLAAAAAGMGPVPALVVPLLQSFGVAKQVGSECDDRTVGDQLVRQPNAAMCTAYSACVAGTVACTCKLDQSRTESPHLQAGL